MPQHPSTKLAAVAREIPRGIAANQGSYTLNIDAGGTYSWGTAATNQWTTVNATTISYLTATNQEVRIGNDQQFLNGETATLALGETTGTGWRPLAQMQWQESDQSLNISNERIGPIEFFTDGSERLDISSTGIITVPNVMTINPDSSILTSRVESTNVDFGLRVGFARNYGAQSAGTWVDVARVSSRCAFIVSFSNTGGGDSPRSWVALLQTGWNAAPAGTDINLISSTNSSTALFDALRIRGFDGDDINTGTPVIQARVGSLGIDAQTYNFSVDPVACGRAFADDLTTLTADTSTFFSDTMVLS